MVRTRANKHRTRSNKQRGGQISYSEEDKGQMRYNGFTEDNITTLEGLNAPANTVIDMLIMKEPTEILAYFRNNPTPNPSNEMDTNIPQILTRNDLNVSDPTSVAELYREDYPEDYKGGKRRKSKRSKKSNKSKKSKKLKKSRKSKKSKTYI
jgi:hypothetical protein